MFWFGLGERLTTAVLAACIVVVGLASVDSVPLIFLSATLDPSEALLLIPVFLAAWLTIEGLTHLTSEFLFGDRPTRTRIGVAWRVRMVGRQKRRYNRVQAELATLQSVIQEDEQRRIELSQSEPTGAAGERDAKSSRSEPSGADSYRERYRALASELLLHFPPSREIGPNRLRNTLRAAESRLDSRYGMDVVVVLPRLLAIIPTGLERQINRESALIKFWVRLAGACAIVGLLVYVASVQALWSEGNSRSVWRDVPMSALWLFLVFAFAIGVSAYRAAIASAVSWGLAVEVAFDIHRTALLEHMHLPVPKDLENQRELFGILSQMLSGASLHNLKFTYSERKDRAAEELVRINNYMVGQAMAVGDEANAKAKRVTFVNGEGSTRRRTLPGGWRTKR